jgi:glycosyltransferase involved in cell wall biosynthesis
VAPVLVIVGDSSATERQALDGLVRQVPAGQLLFPGFRSDVERWLQAFDVFAHAPRLEAFGLVVVEAMATGLPVVATPVGGILDLVRDGQTGFLVPPEAPEKVADALERLIRDRPLRAAMGDQARQAAVAEFDASLYLQRHFQLYQDLLAGRKPCGVDVSLANAEANVPCSREGQPPGPAGARSDSGCEQSI